MPELLSLFDTVPGFVAPEYEPTDTISVRFERFHAANPFVFEALERLALDLHDRGRRFGVKALVEVVRWQYQRTTVGDDGFKINNSFTSRYARLLLEKHAEFEGLLEIRELRA